MSSASPFCYVEAVSDHLVRDPLLIDGPDLNPGQKLLPNLLVHASSSNRLRDVSYNCDVAVTGDIYTPTRSTLKQDRDCFAVL